MENFPSRWWDISFLICVFLGSVQFVLAASVSDESYTRNSQEYYKYLGLTLNCITVFYVALKGCYNAVDQYFLHQEMRWSKSGFPKTIDEILKTDCCYIVVWVMLTLLEFSILIIFGVTSEPSRLLMVVAACASFGTFCSELFKICSW
ncbi:hypothetical protein GIB67_000727 [Kingdonia uniflora]|uniref:Uncharacterized protein n=1 Tax=Kingdonia uniflora TaxID=39325 RepID=A0A7J7NDI4_9MAGN|nr:hypothetical protein GIB67_000727 [Kingdonia uniflora]